MTEIFRPPFFQPDAVTGAPLAGALLYFYAAGTTTPITTYTDSGLGTPQANPVVADASGIFAPIFVNTATYKIVLKTSAGVTVYTADNIVSTASSTAVTDSTFRIQDDLDATRQIAFQASGITTGTTRTITVPDKSGTLAMLSDLPSSTQGTAPVNLALAAAVGSSALTISLKGVDGNDPSATNPVYIPFRNVTVATGTPSYLTITAATSLVISSGSTLGFTSAVATRLWIVAFNDAGTIRLGAITCTTLASGALLQYPLAALGIASSTAEGGAGAADSAQTFYTGAAVTSKAYTVLGYFSFETGVATAGTWAAVPTRIQLFDPSVPLPGRVVQAPGNVTGAVATGTTLVPEDDTIPQNTEGDQYMSQAITPSSAANLLRTEAQANLANSVNGYYMAAALFQDSTASALSVVKGFVASTAGPVKYVLDHTIIAGTTSATTMKLRAGGRDAGTTTFNGLTGTRQYGGVFNSFMRVSEIAA
ncbi:MAG: hypothetical protein JWM16_6361 [Verrucomicrobiales bacterium]|nr:hypothetical protein [Verrucomicrobiales bacterium]